MLSCSAKFVKKLPNSAEVETKYDISIEDAIDMDRVMFEEIRP